MDWALSCRPQRLSGGTCCFYCCDRSVRARTTEWRSGTAVSWWVGVKETKVQSRVLGSRSMPRVGRFRREMRHWATFWFQGHGRDRGLALGLIQGTRIYALISQRVIERCCNFSITTNWTPMYQSMYISRSISYSTVVANPAPRKTLRTRQGGANRIGVYEPL